MDKAEGFDLVLPADSCLHLAVTAGAGGVCVLEQAQTSTVGMMRLLMNI